MLCLPELGDQLRKIASRPATLALLLASSLAPSGCAEVGGGGASATCTVSAPCGPPPPDGGAYAVELLSPDAVGAGQQEVAVLKMNDGWSAQVRVLPTVTLNGTVVDEKGLGVAAQLVATRPSSIAGRPMVARSLFTKLTGEFVFTTVPGIYSMRVVPDGPARADHPPTTVVLDTSTSLAPTLRLRSAGPITGRITNALGAGLNGVTVRAVDPASGLLLSSVATSQKPLHGLDGQYRIELSAEATGLSRVRVIADGTTPAALYQDVDPASALAGTTDLTMPPLPMPELPFTIPVLGRSSSGALLPVPAALVQVQGDVSDAGSLTRARFAASTVTDDQGHAGLTLVPGGSASRLYQLTVTPPADSAYLRQSFTITVAATGGWLGALELGPRKVLVGNVVGPDGAALRGALINPRIAASDSAAGAPSDLPLPQAVSDERGGFVLRLEPAHSYDLLVAPPRGQGLGRWSEESVYFEDDITLTTPLRLPRAASATVTVLDSLGRPAAGVEVRFYDLTCARPPDRPCLPRLRADTRSGVDGVARMLVSVPGS